MPSWQMMVRQRQAARKLPFAHWLDVCLGLPRAAYCIGQLLRVTAILTSLFLASLFRLMTVGDGVGLSTELILHS